MTSPRSSPADNPTCPVLVDGVPCGAPVQIVGRCRTCIAGHSSCEVTFSAEPMPTTTCISAEMRQQSDAFWGRRDAE